MNVNIQIPQGPIADSTGQVTLEWNLLIQSLIALSGQGQGPSIQDLATQMQFTSDNTSQVADLQWQIDHLDLFQSPFEMGNAEVTAAENRISSVEVTTEFIPSSAINYAPIRFAWNSRYVAAAYG